MPIPFDAAHTVVSRGQPWQNDEMNEVTHAADADPRLAEKVRLLGRTRLFQGMAAETLGALAARATTRAMRAGEVLFRRGDPGTALMVILLGQVRIVLPSPDGREQVLRVMGQAEMLGELALLDGGNRTADAVAETNGQLLSLERSAFLQALRDSPELALSILATISGRLRATNWLLEVMLFHEASARLAATLLMLARGQPGGRVDITQGALGARVGAARETVNKKLREWQAAGIIALQPGRVVVRDQAALRRHAPPMGMAEEEIPPIW
jgi:CRP/FNR family transcriptional regulator, cyclic AMP receptor protein